jgi:ribose-phosphate pyrophosphokinase
MPLSVFSLPGNEDLALRLARSLRADVGSYVHRRFPDGEYYARVDSEVHGVPAVLVCTLNNPDERILPLFFLASTLKDLGAKTVILVAPYLSYMRQDRRFQEGEGVTSRYFARFLSNFLDGLVTVDPHLHRYPSLGEIYSIPTLVVHAAPRISAWVRTHVSRPFFVGPDEESQQWVGDVAAGAGAPHTVLQKIRRGDRDVEISIPQAEEWKDRTPVIVDDIISSGATMAETVRLLKKGGFSNPVCIGVHGIFSGNAYQDLLAAGAGEVVTCNTIPHPSNAIDLTDLLQKALEEMLPI